jgi:hypothetical protein
MNEDEFIYALIAEGGSEHAMLDVLLKHDLLKFKKEQVLKEKVLRTRSGAKFQNEHLKQGFRGRKLIIYRVLDSKVENFKLGKAYQQKVEKIIDLRTRPEIEMLFIIHFDDYKKYNQVKSKMKPSDFAKQSYGLHIGNVKAYDDVFAFWDVRPCDLKNAIVRYAQLTDDDEVQTLSSILKK